jgi:hypothetical protein
MGWITNEEVGAAACIKFQLRTHNAPEDEQFSKLNINYSL